MDKKFEKYELKKSLSSMISFDFKRLFVSKFFYIIIACCLVAPILILVMTKMMEGSPMTDQNGNPILDQFGNPVLMEGFKSVWQMLGSTSTYNSGMTMDLVGMCNINMVFMLVAVFICLFISDDFRSGFTKNLFTVRARKGDYVASKTISGFICGAFMLIAYFGGSMLGGAISGLSFSLHGLNAGNIAMCLVAKIFLMLVFVAIDVIVSVAAKQKAWLCLCGSLGAGMLLFMMVSLITPLGSTPINVILCLAGGILFSVGLGTISNKILQKTSLV